MELSDNIKLTSEEINLLETEAWLDYRSESYLRTVLESEDREIENFLSKLKDNKVIELGPGDNPINIYRPCREYIGIQPFPELGQKEGYQTIDALSFLRKQPSSSAVIVSFGLVDDSILIGRAVFKPKTESVATRYMNELGEEIKRVYSPFSIIVGISAGEVLGNPDIYSKCWGKSLGRGGVYIKK